MKAKLTMSREPALERLWGNHVRPQFYRALWEHVLGELLSVDTPLLRRAAYYPQEPDAIDSMDDGVLAVVFQLTGISRAQRSSHRFQLAYQQTVEHVIAFVRNNAPRGAKVQVMIQFALDSQMEVAEGVYSSLIDSCEIEVEGEFAAAA